MTFHLFDNFFVRSPQYFNTPIAAHDVALLFSIDWLSCPVFLYEILYYTYIDFNC